MRKEPTTVEPNFHGGKKVETRWWVDDKNVWVIGTQKRFNKKVSTIARLEKLDGPFLCWQTGDPMHRLAEEGIRATEKALIAQHELALKKLEELLK